MKVLHISHHIGCMRDHAYIYNKLNLDYTFWKFKKNLFFISKDVANSIWNEKKDWFNTFDYIVTSDTAPLSRIFLENISDLKPKVIVWICNRFDYNMERDKSYYSIFNFAENKMRDKVKIIPYSDFEEIWCSIKGINLHYDTITPIGKELVELDNRIDGLIELKDTYVNDTNSKQYYAEPLELSNKIFIPIYGNDNKFFNLNQILTQHKIDVFNGGYKHPVDLQNCKALVTFPDAFSKLIVFETIQNGVIVFLPSEEYLIKLHPMKQNNVNYWFNSPIGNLNKITIKLCEWYRYKECRIYFDSIEDLIYKINHLDTETIKIKKQWCEIYSKQIEETSINKWKEILEV